MKTKKAFTLIELMVVLMIIGILATLGLTQYTRQIEKSRGAEAREVLGVIRSLALAHFNEYDSLTAVPVFNNAAANIGAAVGQIPSAPRGSHFFTYSVATPLANRVVITAIRCSNNAACKGGLMSFGGQTMTLQTDCPDGTDVPNIPAPWN